MRWPNNLKKLIIKWKLNLFLKNKSNSNNGIIFNFNPNVKDLDGNFIIKAMNSKNLIEIDIKQIFSNNILKNINSLENN